MKRSLKRKKPAKRKSWTRRYASDPWNNPGTRLELFISPTLQLKLGLAPHYVEKEAE